jgi:hypothetical protein
VVSQLLGSPQTSDRIRSCTYNYNLTGPVSSNTISKASWTTRTTVHEQLHLLGNEGSIDQLDRYPPRIIPSPERYIPAWCLLIAPKNPVSLPQTQCTSLRTIDWRQTTTTHAQHTTAQNPSKNPTTLFLAHRFVLFFLVLFLCYALVDVCWGPMTRASAYATDVHTNPPRNGPSPIWQITRGKEHGSTPALRFIDATKLTGPGPDACLSEPIR